MQSIRQVKKQFRHVPTFDERVGKILMEENKDKPDIADVIDRRATEWRMSHEGSKYDDMDILGLREQEEKNAIARLQAEEFRRMAMRQGSDTARQRIAQTQTETATQKNYGNTKRQL